MSAPAPRDLKRRVEEWKRKVLEVAERPEPSPEGFEEEWDYYDVVKWPRVAKEAEEEWAEKSRLYSELVPWLGPCPEFKAAW
jgi:hypothetical protein